MASKQQATSVDLLMRQIVDGSEAAFRILFDRYYTLLCAISYRYVQEPEVGATLAEDALLLLWEKRDRLPVLASPKAYLMTCVRNLSIDYLRSHKRPLVVQLDANSDTCFLSDDEIFSAYVASELESTIGEAIASLPSECRTVFQMSRYENKTYAEIADELGISINTVKYHIKNALSVMRERLRDFIGCLLLF